MGINGVWLKEVENLIPSQDEFGQALRSTWKNCIPFLGMRKVHGEIQRLNKCALVASKFAGFNAWNTFVLNVEHPYIVRKSKKSLDMGELTFHAKKNCVADCSRKPKYMFNFIAVSNSLKLHKQHSIIQCVESDDFTSHYIIRYLSAHEPPHPRTNLQ